MSQALSVMRQENQVMKNNNIKKAIQSAAFDYIEYKHYINGILGNLKVNWNIYKPVYRNK